MGVPRRRRHRIVRRYRWLLTLIPLVALAAWLVAEQLPTWSAPHSGWFSEAMPGRCAAVASLRARQGTLVGQPLADVEPLLQTAQDAIEQSMGGVNWIVGNPLAVRATLDGASRPAWLVTARGETTGIAPVAVVYLDADTLAVLDVSVGFDDPAASCDFNLRRAVRDAVLSPPFLLIAGYSVLLVVVGVGWLVIKRRSARKG